LLKLAYPHQEALNKKYQEIFFNEKYKFHTYGSYPKYVIDLEDMAWTKLQLLSVDENNNIIGYLCAMLDRELNHVTELKIVNFYDINITFSQDLKQFICDLFLKYNFRKINWTVVVGNPIEKMYDKYTSRYGGRIVGVLKKEVLLNDRKLYDKKIYELFRGDFVQNYNLKHGKLTKDEIMQAKEKLLED
jgi:hypothetical protein